MINATPIAAHSAPAAPAQRTRQRIARCEVIVIESDSRVAHDLLPWADPYIASLMAKLQREEQEVS